MKFPILRWLLTHFDLRNGMADPHEIGEDVDEGIAFSGANLWILIFAILVASVGLNVNSTAVVIGAMLISPLMGPIVGIGYGVATIRVGVIRRGLTSLGLAAGTSLAVSALYFRLTPLTDAGPELLSRTLPTAWDVLIATFGGAAGAVGLTRHERGNVIPGVAIATALMPPLCTAGYGLATAHWSYLFGALYLFFINSVFIVLATFLVVRIMPIPVETFVSPLQKRRVRLVVWGVALLTALPSIYLGARIVQRTVFQHNAQQFVEEQCNSLASYVVTRRINAEQGTISVLLAGQQLSAAQVAGLRAKLPDYNLPDARLTIRQGTARLDSAEAMTFRQGLLEDARLSSEQTMASYEKRLKQLQLRLAQLQAASTGLPPDSVLLREIRVEHPAVRQLGQSAIIRRSVDSLRTDTTVVVAVRTQPTLPPAERQRLAQWLRLRAGRRHSVRLLIEPEDSTARPVVVKPAPKPAARRRTRRR